MKPTTSATAGGILLVGALAGSANATEALVFDNASNQETTVHGDWAFGQFKAECANKWLTGLSEDLTSHVAHAALCDQGGRIATPTSGFRVLDFSRATIDRRPSKRPTGIRTSTRPNAPAPPARRWWPWPRPPAAR